MLINNDLNILIILRLVIIEKLSAVSYNQPTFCSSTTWNPNATTFANKSKVGFDPCGVFINSNNTVYVTNKSNNLILVWFNNSIKPTRTIGKEGVLNPSTLFVTTNGDIYVDHNNNYGRVDKWTLNANTGVLVMDVRNSSCFGLFVDINDTLYCSIYNRHQVVKKRLNDSATTSTIAVGTGVAGSDSNALYFPVGIFVDINFDLYVADCGNDRIQLFRSGQLNATTVAGNRTLNTTITLNRPTGIVLDADKYLFIVDSHNNRIVGSGPNGFRCLVGCSGNGSASNQLFYPCSLSFDSFGNMFVTDKWNDRIQKFLLLTNSCNETTKSQAAPTSTNVYVTSSAALATVSLEINATSTSYERETTAAITTGKPTSTVGSTDSSSITPLLTTIARTISVETAVATEVATTGITEAETTWLPIVLPIVTASIPTAKNTPSSNNFMPLPCKDPTRIGLFCNISNTVCDMLKPCRNNGNCSNNDTQPHGYVCLCPSGFNGTQCQFDHRPCKQNTCWHDGICNETSDTTFICQCQPGWQGTHCEIMENYCEKCENNGVCRPLFLNYTCECLGESFSGRHCEIIATKIQIYRIVSKSFAYVAIIALICVAMFIVIMDILKYCFGIDPVHKERERIRRKKQAKKRKPVIQRFVYVNSPAPSPPEQPNPTIEETTA